MSWNSTEISPTGWILPLDGSWHSSFKFYLGLGRDDVGVVEGFRIPVLVTLRALPVNESEVPSRLSVGVPGIPVPLDPEAVRPLLHEFTKIKIENLITLVVRQLISPSLTGKYLCEGVVNTGMFDVEGVRDLSELDHNSTIYRTLKPNDLIVCTTKYFFFALC